jgi:hypothetical protein
MVSIALDSGALPVNDDANRPVPRPTRRRIAVIAVIGILGVLTTAGVAGKVARQPGLYWSQVNVIFQAPQSALYPNTLLVESEALITTAGVVAKAIDPSSGAHVVSDSVTLVGQGIRNGWSVRLPDIGGQWATNFSRPVLDVEVVGSTAAQVGAMILRLENRIKTVVARLQDDKNVSAVNRITVSPNPETPPMYYQSGSHRRALAATALIGLIATFALCRAVDRRIRRGRRRQRISHRAS